MKNVRTGFNGKPVANSTRHIVGNQTRVTIPSLHGDHEKLIADASVDAVVVAVGLDDHYAIAQAALLAAKHVLVEKPATSDWEEFKDLVTDTAESDASAVV